MRRFPATSRDEKPFVKYYIGGMKRFPATSRDENDVGKMDRRASEEKTGVSRCTAASRKRERKIRGQGKTRAKAAGRARAKRQRAVLAAFVKLETRSHRKNQTTPKKCP